MRTNTKAPDRMSAKTHGGQPAYPSSPETELRRSVLSCLLWESEFYESGQSIADRIRSAAAQVSTVTLAGLAVEARQKFNLRHVPLLLLCELVKRGGDSNANLISLTIERVISRADEMGEFVALYWALNPRKSPNKGAPLPKQMKIGLARAFQKFDEYQLAKWGGNK